nr:immunoglobulin light chain junction region [Macaca mulatta]
CQQHDVSPRTF